MGVQSGGFQVNLQRQELDVISGTSDFIVGRDGCLRLKYGAKVTSKKRIFYSLDVIYHMPLFETWVRFSGSIDFHKPYLDGFVGFQQAGGH